MIQSPTTTGAIGFGIFFRRGAAGASSVPDTSQAIGAHGGLHGEARGMPDRLGRDSRSHFAPRSHRQILKCATVLLLGAQAALSQGSEASLSDHWVFQVPRSDGSFDKSYFELEQMGERIAGSALHTGRFGRGDTPIAEGSFQDGLLRFTVSLPGRATPHEPDPKPTVLRYEGRPSGEGFAMTRTGSSRSGSGEFIRVKAEVARPPRTPRPPLRDVPDNGLARTPPMGWNSWNKFKRDIDDKTVREIADAMVESGMRDAGYVYINIDDTWAGERDADGRITGNRKFPDMKALADYVHSKGLKFGLYSAPGPVTCAGYEGSYGYEELDARTYAEWGVDFLKYDWCRASGVYDDDEIRLAFQIMGEALQKTGRPIVYSLSFAVYNVWEWGPKVGANLWRTTGDIQDNWESVERIGFGPSVAGGPEIPGQPKPLGQTQYDVIHAASPGRWNDPDMLEVGNGQMTADEYRTHFTLWCMLRAPLLAGNDLRNMTEETKSILLNREVIAIDQDAAALPMQRVSRDGDTEVYLRPLHDGDLAVALFNRGDAPAEVGVTWESLGIDGRPRAVRDLWKHEPVEIADRGYTATVPTHGVVLLRVKTR